MINVNDVEKEYLSMLAHQTGDYPIDAEDMMKELGIASQNAKSKDIGKSLVRSNIIPKLDLKKLTKEAKAPAVPLGQEGTAVPSSNLSLFENRNSQVIRTSEIKNGKTYYPIKYKLTINASHKVLMRAYNDDKFADYFSIQLQLIEKYKKYQSDYGLHLNKIALSQKEDKIDNLTQEVREQNAKIDRLLAF